MANINVIGGGAWGTTLAQVLVDNGHKALVYERNEENAKKINSGFHPFFNLKLSIGVKATTNLMDIVNNKSDMCLLVIPSSAVRSFFTELNSKLERPVSIVSAVKGLEPGTGLRVSEIAKEILGEKLLNFAALSGPSHAEDVILKKVTLLLSASENHEFAKKVQLIFNNDTYIRVYSSTDLIGTEYAGSMKNALAVISGIITGLDLGENARAAMLTRGLNEIRDIILRFGGKIETIYGLAGLGDLIVTATSNKSRNFRAGLNVAKGLSEKTALQSEAQTIEGFRVIHALCDMVKKEGIQLPIIEMAGDFLNKKISYKKAIEKLLKRDVKEE